MSPPSVTVVVPTKDRVDWLEAAALPAALAQEDVELDVVVVADGTSDDTAERLRARDDQRLRVIVHDRPAGVAHARNAGIAAARGDWVAFLDDDDLWAPHKLRTQIAAAEATVAGFAYAAALAVDATFSPLFVIPAPPADRLAERLLARSVIWGGASNVVVRRALLSELGGFDERLFQLADWDLWTRLALASRAAACPEVLVAIVQHGGSMLVTEREDVFAEFDALVAKHRAARERLGVDVDTRAFARWVAQGHRRAGRRVGAARAYVRSSRRRLDLGALARAGGSLLGERALGHGARVFRTRGAVADAPPAPEWLRAYSAPADGERSARIVIRSS